MNRLIHVLAHASTCFLLSGLWGQPSARESSPSAVPASVPGFRISADMLDTELVAPTVNPGAPPLEVPFDGRLRLGSQRFPIGAEGGGLRVDGPIWSGEGDQAGAYFGYCVATAGDVNGDGHSDVLVGAYSWDGAFADQGMALLYLGSATGPSSTPAWTATSSQEAAGFGSCVAPAGDVNGDGYDDVIIGCYLYDGGQTNEGSASVYLGSSAGLEPTPVWTREGSQTDAQFGRCVATAGDVNGDGYDDVIVGSQYYDGGQSNEGKVFLYLGGPAGPSASPAWTREGDQPGAQLGFSVAAAGDVNGDGRSDVIIGANLYDNTVSNQGRVWVYLGTTTGLATTAVWTYDGLGASDNLGTSVATAGDINGEGYADVLVGAPYADDPFGGAADEGRAYLFLGSSTGPRMNPIWTGRGVQEGARYGWSVATAGDVNGDLYADIIVGAWGWDGGQTDEGSAAVYLGSALELLPTPIWTHEVDQAGARFGWSVATAGDVDSDGRSDVLVGTWYWDDPETNEGGAWVFRGAASGLDDIPGWLEVGDQWGGWLGAAVAGAGDVNADGFSDILYGAPFYTVGSAPRVGQVWEHLGYPEGPHPIANWTGIGEQFEADYGRRVATAGDVNGDGYDDILVSAYDHSFTDNSYEGKVWLHLGSENGVLDEASWVRTGDRQNARLGYALASAGDVNGDGYGDVLIGSDYYSNGSTFEGKVWLYLGSADGLSEAPVWEREGNRHMVTLGAAVASAGDVNRDGYSDVVVGAPALVQTGLAGQAYLFLGSPAGLGDAPVWTGSFGQLDDFYGASVASAGDFNGDGYGDVIVGAHGYEEPGYPSGGGAVALYLGSPSGLSASPVWYSWSDQMGASLGYVVGNAGDVNGDGFSDVFFTAPYLDGAHEDQGAVWVKLGSPGGSGGLPEWFETVEEYDTRFGIAADGAGDVNGDGYDDLIVGSLYNPNPLLWAGFTAVYFGNEKNLSYRGRALIGRHTHPDGGPLSWLGKSDSETDFGLAATITGAGGRARLRLEWQNAVLGAPLGSAPIERGSWALSWGPLPDAGSVLPVLELVEGGSPGTTRVWRCRAAARSPFFPHGPWMSMPGTVPTEPQLRLAGMPSGVETGPPSYTDIARIEAIWPNPVSLQTALVYSLSSGGRVRLSLHDVSGRELGVLVDEWNGAGRHKVRWDRDDQEGRRLPSGVYLARLAIGEEVRTAKLVVSR